MTTETYNQSGPGPYEDAELNKQYRAIFMQGNGAATTLTVKSSAYIKDKNTIPPDQSLHITPGDLIPGNTIIVAGTLTGIKGYLP